MDNILKHDNGCLTHSLTGPNTNIILMEEAAAFLADASKPALPRILQRLTDIVSAASTTVYTVSDGVLRDLSAGRETSAQRHSAQLTLTTGMPPDGFHALSLTSGTTVIGIASVQDGPTFSESVWMSATPILKPLLTAALQQEHWRHTVEAAQGQVEQQMREVATVYEIGQAMGRVTIEQLLEIITAKAAAVMEAQACSLMLWEADTNSLRIAASWGLTDEIVENTRIFFGEGIAGQVAATGEPLRLDDLSDDPRFKDAAIQGRPDVSSSLCMPMKDDRGSVLGVLCIRRRAPSPRFRDEDVRLFSIFASQASLAISNARLYDLQERRCTELTMLYEVSRHLSATSGVEKAAEMVNTLAIRVTESDCGILLLFDDACTGLYAVDWRGLPEAMTERLQRFTSPVEAAAAMRALQTPCLLSADEINILFGANWQPILEALLARHRAVALVPLVVDNEGIGCLLLGKRRAEYGAEELKLIAAASSQAASVLHNAHVYEERIEKRDLEISTLRELMQNLRQATTLREAFDAILEIVASLVPSERSRLLTLDKDGRTLTVQVTRGNHGQPILGKQLPVDGDSLAAQALRARRAMIATPKTPAEMRDLLPLTADQKSRSALAVPLILHDKRQPLGVLVLESSAANPYTEETVRVAHLAASQGAIIFDEMRLLRDYTRYTENILHSIPAGVITVNNAGEIVTWNRRAAEIAHLSAAEITEQHYSEFIKHLQIEPPMHDEAMHLLEMTAKTGEISTGLNMRSIGPRGEEAYLSLGVSPLRSEAGTYLGTVIILEDITNETQMKEALERVNRLAETGQLAANIAHELRNPLSSIKGAAQLLQKDLRPEDDMQREFLEIIVDEVNGLNRITTEFLEFARNAPLQRQMVNIGEMIQRQLQLMQTYFADHDTVVSTNLDDQLSSVMLDRAQIEQVLKNILINGVQAMPHGGSLTVTARPALGQDMLEISVSDTGSGITPDKLDRIFTPFFTTKTKGTGLGLAIARKTIETHGGRIDVYSAPTLGATFSIYLPVHPINPISSMGLRPLLTDEITEQRSENAKAAYFQEG